MDIISFALSFSVCFPIAILLSRIGRNVPSKPINARPLPIVPVLRYYLPDGLTQEQQRQMMFLRWMYERGDFLPGAMQEDDSPEEQAVAD